MADKIKRVRHNAVGADPAVLARRELADAALTAMAHSQPIYRVFAGVFASASNEKRLAQRVSRILAILSSQGLRMIAPHQDPIAQDSFLRALPFGYDDRQDSSWYARRARLWHSDHIARMLPFMGRSIGTGRPGMIYYNRGAEVLAYDPLHPLDRRKNAHSLILGPTGSGKTSMLIYSLLHLLAVRRPRLWLLTALPTFHLFADYCERSGLSVAHKAIAADGSVTLPPFTNASKINLDTVMSPVEEGTLRDLLGEMEIQARLMITGGSPAEEAALRRDDRSMLRRALIEAGKKTAPNKHTLTEDVVAALNEAAAGQLAGVQVPPGRRESAARMAGSMELFCTGVDGLIFNRPGVAWPDVDVTVVELGLYARKGYEDRLAVAMTGLMTAIQNQVEAEQYSDRQTIVVVDEAHVLLQNPLVSPYLARIVATWRTYGAWLWIATQNLRQFPDSAKELLDQPEWWQLLAVDEDEVEQISRFRTLTPEQRAMILSARKSPGQYTEGAVMSGHLLNLFRNVPPALALALAQTEKHEKAERDRIRRRHNFTELEAAMEIAKRIRQKRASK